MRNHQAFDFESFGSKPIISRERQRWKIRRCEDSFNAAKIQKSQGRRHVYN